MSIVSNFMKVVTGVSDYKHGKAMQHAERASIDTSMHAYGQLNSLMDDPSKITEMPMYKAGLEAVQRSLGQQGLTGSGNAVLGLAEYGGNFYQQQLSSLASIARGGTPEFGSGNKSSAGGAGRFGQGFGDVSEAAGKMFSQMGGGGGGAVNGSAGTASVAAMA